ncbi:MAG: hypothetical protein SFV51_22125 [Bryobacteraceae bacterium]|nr:hypothetical protein [Bryobacteraceae bacterium]
MITNGGFARVETGIDIDRFYGGLAQSSAYWRDQVTLTFLGADGGGFFMPCVSMDGGGSMLARFELAGTAPTVSGLPSRQGLTFGTPPTPDQNCGTSLATPGNGLGFFFNVPFRMNIELLAGMSENTSRSWFDSNYLSFDSFAVSRFPECSGATCSYFPEPAVWLMEPVPEPGFGLGVAVLLAAIVGFRRQGAGSCTLR